MVFLTPDGTIMVPLFSKDNKRLLVGTFCGFVDFPPSPTWEVVSLRKFVVQFLYLLGNPLNKLFLVNWPEVQGHLA